VQLFELLEIKFCLQLTQLNESEVTKILLAKQLVQTPEYFVQLAQLMPHEIQELLVLFKYFPGGQTVSSTQVLLFLL
jgi:hypothetical protein